MPTNTSNWVTGLFMSRDAAERAVEAIMRAGYTRDEVSVLMRDSARSANFPQVTKNAPDTGDEVAKGVGVGGVVGGSVGAVLAAIAAAGTSIVFPGFGLVVAGPIAAALAGAGAGGAAGGLVGAIVGAGIPEAHAKRYEIGLMNGGMVVGVKSSSKEQERKLEQWLAEAGAEKITVS